MGYLTAVMAVAWVELSSGVRFSLALHTKPDWTTMPVKQQVSYFRLPSESPTWTLNGSTKTYGAPRIIAPVTGKQYTSSTSHPVHLIGKVDKDIGGAFFTSKQTYREVGGGPFGLSSKPQSLQYGADNAYALPRNPNGSFPVSVAAGSLSDLVAFGTTAIARTAPTNPHADIFTFLGELREGLPSMVGRSVARRPNLKTSSEEYLNWQFGLLPILNDFRKFGQTFVNREKILRDMINNAEKPVHRRYQGPVETDTTNSSVSGYSYPAYVTALHGPPGTITTETVTTTKRWFSGSFQYHYPEAKSLLGDMQRFLANARVLAGLPSVETLWNLAPWSWAVDWFSNVGDVIHNFAEFSNGLVLRYGYVMEHRKATMTRTFRGTMRREGEPFPVESSQIWSAECKTRIRATPFGFGLSDGDLTPRQLAITAALGITRA